jgi:hypothetical protein
VRSLFGMGTPRTLQDRAIAIGALLSALWTLIYDPIAAIWTRDASPAPVRRPSTASTRLDQGFAAMRYNRVAVAR